MPLCNANQKNAIGRSQFASTLLFNRITKWTRSNNPTKHQRNTMLCPKLMLAIVHWLKSSCFTVLQQQIKAKELAIKSEKAKSKSIF